MAQTVETYDERMKVETWRLHVLMEAGYPVPLAEPEPLDPECSQPQLALRLEQLRPPVHVHAFAVLQVEP